MAEEFEEYKMIQSIPGIGGKIAATIISEMGEIDSFNHPKKLVRASSEQPLTKSRREDLLAFGKPSIPLCNVESQKIAIQN
ncbi:Transposase IS116/IS110/IS902 family protein [Alteribacillus bidgolensis]|uniref:Transposase IS116/IS110/IS902 family protein n=1 Tax=Alteribacillus bidgolensis TaxID=930129 RepID=A0A1G8NKZ5_9BACI|nr:Transposase IS116/IS110/IS902 family protein [Alteribacillus bidgolensis]